MASAADFPEALATDPIIQVINQLFGLADAAAPLAPYILIVNKYSLVAAGLLIIGGLCYWTVAAAMVGKFLGDHVDKWAIFRFLFAVSLLPPLPPHGFNLAQIAIGSGLKASVGVASMINEFALARVVGEGQPITVAYDPQARSLAEDITAFAACGGFVAMVADTTNEYGAAQSRIVLVDQTHSSRTTFEYEWQAIGGEKKIGGVCGRIVIELTGDTEYDQAAYAGRVAAVSSILDQAQNKIWPLVVRSAKDRDMAPFARAVASIVDDGETAFKNAAVEFAAGAWQTKTDRTAEVASLKAAGWTAAGATIVKLQSAQSHLLQAMRPGSVTVVVPDDLDAKWKTLYGDGVRADFAVWATALNEAMSGLGAAPIFDTTKEAAAAARKPFGRSLAMLIAGPISLKDPFGDVAKQASDVVESVDSKALLYSKKLFVAALNQPAAVVIAAPFSSLATIGEAVYQAGIALAGGGTLTSLVPIIGGIGNLATVFGFVLIGIGGFVAYVMPMVPVLAWNGFLITWLTGALMALIGATIGPLWLLNLKHASLLGKPSIWLALIGLIIWPVVATIGLIALTFMLGSAIWISNYSFKFAFSFLLADQGASASAYIVASAVYLVSVIFGSFYVVIKSMLSLGTGFAKFAGLDGVGEFDARSGPTVIGGGVVNYNAGRDAGRAMSDMSSQAARVAQQMAARIEKMDRKKANLDGGGINIKEADAGTMQETMADREEGVSVKPRGE